MKDLSGPVTPSAHTLLARSGWNLKLGQARDAHDAWCRTRHRGASRPVLQLLLLAAVIKSRLKRMRYRRGLLGGFITHTGLTVKPSYPHRSSSVASSMLLSWDPLGDDSAITGVLMSRFDHVLNPDPAQRAAPGSSPVATLAGVPAGQVRVEPAALEQAASKAGALENELRSVDVALHTTAAVRGLAGWETARRLEQVQSRLQDLVTGLANRLGGVSERLAATARNYRDSDEAVRRRFDDGR